PSKRYTLLLCLIHRTRVQCRDQLALMLIKRMNKIQQRGKDELEALRLQYREKTAGLVSLLAEVVIHIPMAIRAKLRPQEHRNRLVLSRASSRTDAAPSPPDHT